MKSRFPAWLSGTFLERHVLHFESQIQKAVGELAQSLPQGARVLDAGAGEGRYERWFPRQQYVGVDLAIGDPEWNYTGLDAIADLAVLPFPDAVFDAALNIVTLEHLAEPLVALREIGRTLKPGGRLLLAVPHQWEVHQAPHDYFRFTRYGVEWLLRQAGFEAFEIAPAGGFFRLLARRTLNAMQFFPLPLWPLAALILLPAGLLLPALDFLDRRRDFTLGYICSARKR